jgi:hypothetical protein
MFRAAVLWRLNLRGNQIAHKSAAKSAVSGARFSGKMYSSIAGA